MVLDTGLQSFTEDGGRGKDINNTAKFSAHLPCSAVTALFRRLPAPGSASSYHEPNTLLAQKDQGC